MSKKEIDAVVTWVDGSDPALAAKISAALRSRKNRGLTYIPHGRGRDRFTDNNEIEYCIRGIRKFAPWIRQIFLVTAHQIPRFLDLETQQNLNVTVVDHETIFDEYQQALPTFNSISIGSVLHKIPGIADRYIYFNDDTIPIRAFEPDDFFRSNKMVVRGRWERMPILPRIDPTLLGFGLHLLTHLERKPRSIHLLPQMRAAIAAGFSKKFIHLDHAPHPARVETLKLFFLSNENALVENIQHKFRNLKQFTGSALAAHLEASGHNCVMLTNQDALTLDFRKPQIALPRLQGIYSPAIKFLCLQDLQHAPHAIREEVVSFLNASIFGSGGCP